jgi:hypothetical protein
MRQRNDGNGNALGLAVLDQTVFCSRGCLFTEEFAIELLELFVEVKV